VQPLQHAAVLKGSVNDVATLMWQTEKLLYAAIEPCLFALRHSSAAIVPQPSWHQEQDLVARLL
jgi:hypothetical protein